MTDAEVLRQINRRLDKQDEQLSAIREEQMMGILGNSYEYD